MIRFLEVHSVLFCTLMGPPQKQQQKPTIGLYISVFFGAVFNQALINWLY